MQSAVITRPDQSQWGESNSAGELAPKPTLQRCRRQGRIWDLPMGGDNDGATWNLDFPAAETGNWGQMPIAALQRVRKPGEGPPTTPSRDRRLLREIVASSPIQFPRGNSMDSSVHYTSGVHLGDRRCGHSALAEGCIGLRWVAGGPIAVGRTAIMLEVAICGLRCPHQHPNCREQLDAGANGLEKPCLTARAS
jgi:hypothetical protein